MKLGVPPRVRHQVTADKARRVIFMYDSLNTLRFDRGCIMLELFFLTNQGVGKPS